MGKIEEVESFLQNFKLKLGLWGILIRNDRQKNAQTLADLELRQTDLINILSRLTSFDYSEGGLTDSFFGGAEMWVFGKQVKGQEIYIKITLGAFNSQVICISFHFAEFPMNYPFREQT